MDEHPAPAHEIQISGADDEGVVWAMQLVVFVPRETPPLHEDAVVASARAVALLLDDPRSRGDGGWAREVERFWSGRIRKIVRRARASAWERALTVPGVTAAAGSATVHACVPAPLGAAPKEISRLQIADLVLGAGGGERRDPVLGSLRVALNPHLGLSSGKACAQAGHAAQLALRGMDDAALSTWRGAGHAVDLVAPDSWGEFCSVAPVVVQDAGFTEVAPGSVTAAANWLIE